MVPVIRAGNKYLIHNLVRFVILNFTDGFQIIHFCNDRSIKCIDIIGLGLDQVSLRIGYIRIGSEPRFKFLFGLVIDGFRQRRYFPSGYSSFLSHSGNYFWPRVLPGQYSVSGFQSDL